MWHQLGILILCFTALGCTFKTGDDPANKKAKVVFKDSFERSSLGKNWLDTSNGKYSIVNGALRVKGARNKPLWLMQKLPKNSKVELTARSMSDAVDIKVELYGDGKSYAKTVSYTATSYVAILGGWNNSKSIIARMDEHGDDVAVTKRPKGKKGKRYKFSILKNGKLIKWLLDGIPFLKLLDPSPLEGPGHEFFAFNNWDSEVYFDDFVVYEL